MSTRAPCTSLITCCAGVRLLWISAPAARSRTSEVKALTTASDTSASSNARRISRRTSSTCFSDRRPRPRSRRKISSNRSERVSNISLLLGYGQVPGEPLAQGSGVEIEHLFELRRVHEPVLHREFDPRRAHWRLRQEHQRRGRDFQHGNRDPDDESL